jgi:hypothetical protein
VTWQAADEPDLDDFLPVVPHLVVDILYSALDPRVRLAEAK